MMTEDSDEPAGDAATGHGNVDRILASLDGLDDRPVADHAGVYLEILDRLGGELDPEQILRRAGTHAPS